MPRTSRKAVLTVASGTLLGQVAGALAMPVVARVYEPAQFGRYAAISAILIVVGSVASGKYDLAIPIPRKESGAYSAAGAGLLCAVLAALLVVVFAWLFPGVAADVSGGGGPWAWTIGSLGVLGLGGTTVLNQLAARQRRFKAIAQRNAVQPAVLSGSQVALGLAGFGSLGLVAGFALGNLFGFASLLLGGGFTSEPARAGLRRSKVLAAAQRFSRFPRVMVPSGLLNSAGAQVPVVLIAYVASSHAAGWYGLTQRVLALPVALAGTAMAYVYLAEASKTLRAGPTGIVPLFLATSRQQLVIAAAVAMGTFALGPVAFGFIFGPEWEPAGQFARAMSLAVGAQLLATPTSQTLMMAERQRTQLVWDVLRLAGVVSAILGTYALTNDVLAAVWAFSIVSLLAYAVMWLLNWNAAKYLAQRPFSPDDEAEVGESS